MHRNRFVIIDNDRLPVRGDLIRNTYSSPNFVNVVHKVVEVGANVYVYSTRLFEKVGERISLLDGRRARPFLWCDRGSWYQWRRWHIVEQITAVTVDNEAEKLAALNRGFEQWVDPENDSDESGEEDIE